MLKVKEEKFIEDYSNLIFKQNKGLAAVETDARAYAQAHGYDEEKTAKFIEFTQGIQGSGLTDIELAKLEVLSSYIEEVEELIKEVAEQSAENSNAVVPNAVVNRV